MPFVALWQAYCTGKGCDNKVEGEKVYQFFKSITYKLQEENTKLAAQVQLLAC